MLCSHGTVSMRVCVRLDFFNNTAGSNFTDDFCARTWYPCKCMFCQLILNLRHYIRLFSNPDLFGKGNVLPKCNETLTGKAIGIESCLSPKTLSSLVWSYKHWANYEALHDETLSFLTMILVCLTRETLLRKQNLLPMQKAKKFPTNSERFLKYIMHVSSWLTQGKKKQ